MRNDPFRKGMVIALVSAAAITLSVAGTEAAGEKKGAMMAEKPVGPGLCTARINAFKWGYLNYRTTSGHLLPTVMWCPEASCPAKC